jgi:HEAT repeat protein
MPEVLTVLLAVARKLEKPDDVAARIAENTRSEPEWRVRRENVLMLAERYPEHPATPEALRRACQDENEEVRLRAALGLKDEGRGTLLEIATRESADDGCAATAVAALGEHLPGAAALSILDDALRRTRTGTVRACLVALGRRGGPAAVERLARVLAEEAPDFSVAAAHALAASGAAAAEAPLLQALKDLPVVSTAAAEALGRVGSARAVLPLKDAAAREDVPGLQRVVRQAIAEIQSRLPGASPGQVSLAEGETGQLSLADDSAGRVSVADRGDPR